MNTGKRAFFTCVYIGFIFSVAGSAKAAEGILTIDDILPDWEVSGFNTYRADTFEASGDLSSSPYPNLGFQQFDDFNLQLSRQFSLYENVRLQISGTIDDSEYRSQEEGLIIERGTLTWQKADVSVPFRVEVGDFFGNQTTRTLQRGLKGVQVELQPEFLLSSPHSFQFFSGITNSTYRDLSDNKDIFSGASWLLPETTLGVFALTAVNNITQARNNNPELSQNVYSIAWVKEAEYLQQELDFEVEYALFTGDHSSTGTVEQNQNDDGFFAEMQGRSSNLPLTYRARHERYGEDFRPTGSSITANQRSSELHLGWRFASGLSIRGRVQTFRTNWKSANYTDRDVAGLTFSGTLIPAMQLTGSLGSFVSNNETEDEATRSLTHSTNASFSMPIAEHWVARLGGVFTEVDNRVSGQETVSRQISFGLDHDFSMFGFNGSISPSLNLRNNSDTGNVTQSDISPGVSLYLNKGAHNLAFSHNTQILDIRTVSSTDTNTNQSSLNYSYTHKNHRLELEANYFDRDPRPGNDTEAYRIGVAWTYTFDRPARPIQQTQQTALGAAQTVAASGSPGAFAAQPDMMELTPGLKMEDVRDRLKQSGIVEPLVRGGLEIYETPFIEEIDHRQRLALVQTGGLLNEAVLGIEFDDLGDIDNTLQIFEEVRKILFDRYGTPFNRIEEGEFSSNLRNDLRSGRFKRIIEWQTASGILRFGIPHRTDGQIRMEIIHARSFPAGESNFWSLESLR